MKKSQLKYSRGYLAHKPYQKKIKKRTSLRYAVIFFGGLFLVLILSYTLFFSPIFQIKEIRISGNRIIEEKEILDFLNNFLQKKVLIFFNRNSIFLVSDSKLKEIFTENFPRIYSIKVKKNLFKKTISLEIKERQEIGILCKIQKQQEKTLQEVVKNCYYFDKDGVIFEEAPQTSGSLLLLIKDLSSKEHRLKENVLSRELLEKIIQIRTSLSSQFNLKISDFEINSSIPSSLKANTIEGWYIFFSTAQSIKKQIQALELALDKKIENRKELEYIDLRIENKIYYK